MPGTTEAIFTPIDLEASLGRIEDLQMIVSNEDATAMECEQEQTPRTSDNPFREADSKEQHVISPYPYSETESEIAERRRLHESVGKDWTLGGQTEQQQHDEAGWVELELIPDDDADNDEFSLSSEGSESLKAEEDVELEKIEDPVSFWETNVPASSAAYPNIIPLCVSFSSGCDAPDDMMC